MEAIEAILSRRSIRQYTEQPIPPELIEQILRAAMAAPSARNQQPWQFVVIDDRAILDAIPAINENARMVAQAPCAIVVCGDLDREESKGYWVQDCSAATQNLLVAAHASSLGAVWTGVYPQEERVARIQALLELPGSVIPLAIVALGYPAERKGPMDRYDTARIHRNSW
jgi:nitroreductase